jgi:ankyrin repeat protein
MDKRTFIKALRSWQSEVIESAIAGEPELASRADKIGMTPLHRCAEIKPREFDLKVIDSIKTARVLLAAGADVNAARVIIDGGEEFYATPLWYAVAWGRNFDLARFLVEHGARPDDNAMGAAIWDQDLRMAELLRSHGGNIDHVIRGETPLLRTVRSKRLRLLKWLIDNGARISFQDDKGYTALHYAAKGSHTLAQVEELLRYGAPLDIEAKDGSTPISLARDKGKTKLVVLLRSWSKGR